MTRRRISDFNFLGGTSGVFVVIGGIVIAARSHGQPLYVWVGIGGALLGVAMVAYVVWRYTKPL